MEGAIENARIESERSAINVQLAVYGRRCAVELQSAGIKVRCSSVGVTSIEDERPGAIHCQAAPLIPPPPRFFKIALPPVATKFTVLMAALPLVPLPGPPMENPCMFSVPPASVSVVVLVPLVLGTLILPPTLAVPPLMIMFPVEVLALVFLARMIPPVPIFRMPVAVLFGFEPPSVNVPVALPFPDELIANWRVVALKVPVSKVAVAVAVPAVLPATCDRYRSGLNGRWMACEQ